MRDWPRSRSSVTLFSSRSVGFRDSARRMRGSSEEATTSSPAGLKVEKALRKERIRRCGRRASSMGRPFSMAPGSWGLLMVGRGLAQGGWR